MAAGFGAGIAGAGLSYGGRNSESSEFATLGKELKESAEIRASRAASNIEPPTVRTNSQPLRNCKVSQSEKPSSGSVRQYATDCDACGQ